MDVSKIKIGNTSYNIKDVKARTINHISGLNLAFTSTPKTYQNNKLKGASYIDILAGNTSAQILNRITRVYPSTYVGEEYRKGSGYGENTFFHFDNTTGTISYNYDSLEGWTSNVITIFDIFYQ